MKLNVCTWFCADEIGEESKYQQMRGKSSSKKFQDVYWRNIYLFFLSSSKANYHSKHRLFTNCEPPIVDGISMKSVLEVLNVDIITLPFEYRTPINYYNSWRNQFFEFSILKYIANNFSEDDYWLILDSDCIFTKSIENLPKISLKYDGIMTYKLNEQYNVSINGLTQKQMQKLYSELLHVEVKSLPNYHAGEFFFSRGNWIKTFSEEFQKLWPILLKRHSKGMLKLTEEAHVLSYFYFKFNVNQSGSANNIIKRLWTQPFIYRNVNKNDFDYPILHVPHEKRYGLSRLFKIMKRKSLDYWLTLPNESFNKILKYQLTIPNIHPIIFTTRILPIQLGRILFYTGKKLFNIR